ncbi:MAG: hypothetical protein CMM10_09435 [Rhodospirillaceae bacterium]|nr:hypothetical protein [Rhodospirillaceae bacterium]
MASNELADIKVAIADAGQQNRREIKQILRQEGFSAIFDTDDIEVIHNAIGKDDVDLLIADHLMPEGDIFEIIRNVRHHALGKNPFIVIITIALDPSPEDIRSIIDAGCDDLILKPITTGMVSKRVNSFINDRKQFVVTSDYIGPARRKKHRPGTVEIPEFEVPNPLKARASGGMGDAAYWREVELFSELFNEQKMTRNAVQISYLVDKLLPLYVNGKAAVDVSDPLRRLQISGEDIANRMQGTKFDHVGELCQSILGVVANIMATPEVPEPKDLRLLPELARAIETAFQIDGEEADIARRITESVQDR